MTNKNDRERESTPLPEKIEKGRIPLQEGYQPIFKGNTGQGKPPKGGDGVPAAPPATSKTEKP